MVGARTALLQLLVVVLADPGWLRPRQASSTGSNRAAWEEERRKRGRRLFAHSGLACTLAPHHSTVRPCWCWCCSPRDPLSPRVVVVAAAFGLCVFVVLSFRLSEHSSLLIVPPSSRQPSPP